MFVIGFIRLFVCLFVFFLTAMCQARIYFVCFFKEPDGLFFIPASWLILSGITNPKKNTLLDEWQNFKIVGFDNHAGWAPRFRVIVNNFSSISLDRKPFFHS